MVHRDSLPRMTTKAAVILAAGLGSRTGYDLPTTQQQLADAAGLTPVHVNRTLQDIRAQGLLTFVNQRVEIRSWERLAEVAEFDPGYLMLDEPPHRVAPVPATRQHAPAH